jgi:hypothetical protein
VQQINSGHSDQLDEKPLALPSPNLHEEIASIRESLNQTRTEMSLYRRRIERRQLEVDAHIRRTNVLWAVVLLGIAGLGTAIFYGFHSGALIARFPATQTPVSSAQSRLSPPEEKKNSDPVLEPSPESQPAQAPQAHQEKNASENIASVPPQRESTSTVGATSNPERGVNPSGSNTGLLADAVNRNRIDFEVSRNKTQEVAPGIFLTVRDTNVERQQINGWLQISADGRTVWLRDQGAHKAMIFTTKHDVRSHELIFTRVGKQGVAGYLLIPATSG